MDFLGFLFILNPPSQPALPLEDEKAKAASIIDEMRNVKAFLDHCPKASELASNFSVETRKAKRPNAICVT